MKQLKCARCGAGKNDEVLAVRRFMRHGKTQMNLDNICVGSIDEPLNEIGMEQARASAREFAEENGGIELIVSSPMKRARQTAEIFSENLGGVKIADDDRLRERCVGEIEGKSETPESGAQLLKYDFLPKGATPLQEFDEETLALVRDLSDMPAYDILAVTHGFRMLTIIKLIRGMSVGEIMKYTPPANCEIITFKLSRPCRLCGGAFFE